MSHYVVCDCCHEARVEVSFDEPGLPPGWIVYAGEIAVYEDDRVFNTAQTQKLHSCPHCSSYMSSDEILEALETQLRQSLDQREKS